MIAEGKSDEEIVETMCALADMLTEVDRESVVDVMTTELLIRRAPIS